jgi:DNA invertase Pin-like site-specific DNA recombinase
MLRGRGIFLRSLTEGFDTSTASGRLPYHVLGAVAAFEREVIKERTVTGMKAVRKRGTHVGRPKALAGSGGWGAMEWKRHLRGNGGLGCRQPVD